MSSAGRFVCGVLAAICFMASYSIPSRDAGIGAVLAMLGFGLLVGAFYQTKPATERAESDSPPAADGPKNEATLTGPPAKDVASSAPSASPVPSSYADVETNPEAWADEVDAWRMDTDASIGRLEAQINELQMRIRSAKKQQKKAKRQQQQPQPMGEGGYFDPSDFGKKGGGGDFYS
jgi:hypothetical protein